MAARRTRETRRRPRDVVADLSASLDRRLGERLFREVMRGDSLRPRVTASKAIAAVLTTLIHGLTLAGFAVGVFLIVMWSGVGTVLAGAFCLLLAWAVRPRLGKAPARMEPRHAIPALGGLVDRVAGAVGSGRIDGIAVDPAFNASIRRVGWRRRAYLTIGLPLFQVLDPQERVALLAHELGHDVNGDPWRSGYIGSAIATVVAWHDLLAPSGRRRRGAGGVGAIAELAETITEYLVAGLAAALRAFVRGLFHLVWHESQRAEYLADDISRRVAGTRAAAGALQKLPLAAAYRETIQSSSLGPAGHGTAAEAGSLFRGFRELAWTRFAEMGEATGRPDNEQDVRLDATHPSTRYRIAFHRARAEPGEVTLTSAESERIDGELEPLEVRLQNEITESYRASLYRGGRPRRLLGS